MRYVTDNPDVTDEPDNTGDAPRNPAARRAHDPPRDPAGTPSDPPTDTPSDRATSPASDPANEPAARPAAAPSSAAASGGEPSDMPAMLTRALEPVIGQALEPVLQRLGSIEQTQGQMSDRLDDIEQTQGQMSDRLDDIEQTQGDVSDRLKALEQAPPAAAPPATAQQAAAPPATAPTPAAAPAPAAAPVKSKWNGNGLVIAVATAVLGILATIYIGGFAVLSNQIRDVNDRLDSTNERVTQLGTDLRAEMAAIVERIHAMELRLSELFARLDSLARGQSHTDQRLARVEGTLDLSPLPQPPLTGVDTDLDSN